MRVSRLECHNSYLSRSRGSHSAVPHGKFQQIPPHQHMSSRRFSQPHVTPHLHSLYSTISAIPLLYIHMAPNLNKPWTQPESKSQPLLMHLTQVVSYSHPQVLNLTHTPSGEPLQPGKRRPRTKHIRPPLLPFIMIFHTL